MSNNFNIIEEIEKRGSELSQPEESLGRALKTPMITSVSGSRRVMTSQQEEQRLTIFDSEVPLIQTGYEAQFGEYSSSLVVAKSNYEVIAKISKYEMKPNHHYYLIIRTADGFYDVIERRSYTYITEIFGYMHDNTYLDGLSEGSIIKQGSPIKKSSDFDEYNGRKEGINLLTTYLACERTKEDGIIISESAASRIISPLIQNTRININTNDIPLNLYGGESGDYKILPDIGEDCNGLLMALRREKKEELLFAQKFNKLAIPNISDEKFTGDGMIIDIKVHCNDPELINKSVHYKQLQYYYNQNIEFSRQVINICSQFMNKEQCNYSTELSKLYYDCTNVFNNVPYIREKKFSNIELEVVVLKESRLSQGDKLSNRYGGKGVISQVLPDHLMPRTQTGRVIDVILNSSTCINRENVAQLYETSLNAISDRIIEYTASSCFHREEVIDLILTYLKHIVPSQAEYMRKLFDAMSEEEQDVFISELVNAEEGIFISAEPITDNIDVNTIKNIYNDLSFIKPEKLLVPIKNSMGETRYVETRRPLVAGKQYMLRMKQYAEDKSSATSLSATDIKGLNTKSRNKKVNKSKHSKTCIKFGDMEIGNLLHMNPEVVITMLMLHSLSPKGRRLCEGLLLDEPFKINIDLDDESTNRQVEILDAYLKTMGLKFTFTKTPKKMTQLFVPSQEPKVKLFYESKEALEMDYFIEKKPMMFRKELFVKDESKGE